MTTTVNNDQQQATDVTSSQAVLVTRLGYPNRRRLERKDKVVWTGKGDTDEKYEKLTPLLKQVEYRSIEGRQHSYRNEYAGKCPNEECYSHKGKEKRSLRIEVFSGVGGEVQVWCEGCSYDDDFPISGRELVDMALSKVKPEPKRTTAGIDLSTVTPKTIDWLWERRLPLGKFILLDGDPGLAKSILVMDWIARLTTGRGLPDSEKQFNGGAVLVGLEDSIEDTVVPRLIEAKADLTKISVLNTVKGVDKDGREFEEPFTLQDITHLDKLREEVVRKDAKLVFIDSLMGVLGIQTNTWNDQSTRRALMPVVRMAEELNIVVVAIRHLNKGSNDNILYRGGGSIAMIGLARVGLMVVKHPHDENIRILINSKNNLSKMAVQGLTPQPVLAHLD